MKRRRDKHTLALRSIREFLKGRSCYDCLPVSFRLVVLDTKLIVKPALDIMWQAGIVSAPLWQSTSDPSSGESSTTGPLPAGTSAEEQGGFSSLASATTHQPPSDPPADVEHAVSPRSQAPPNRQWATVSASPSPSLAQSELNSVKSLKEGSSSSGKAGFAGMLTVNDIIHLIQYYYQNSSYDNAAQDVERFRLEMLRDVEQSLHVPPPPLLSIDPMRPIFDACQLLMKTHARRLPLLDHDEQTGMDVVVSVLTQYRVLKFIAMNCRETAGLHRTIRSLGIGTYISSMRSGMTRSMTISSNVSSSRRSSNAAHSMLSPGTFSEASAPPSEGAPLSDAPPTQGRSPPQEDRTTRIGSGTHEPLAIATLDTTVFDVVHIFSELGISGIPILDEDGYVVDLYETVDVIDLVRSNAYQSLDLTIRQALSRRSKDFSGVMTCSPDDSLATIFALLRTRRVHRILILEPEPEKQPSQLSSSAIEHERALHAAVASDTGAIGDAQSIGGDKNTAGSAKAAQQKDANGILGEIGRRKRGKLVGILCLSDIMRYIIGAPSGHDSAPLSHTPSIRAGRGGAASGGEGTAPSSIDHADSAGNMARPRQGSGESGTRTQEALEAVYGTAEGEATESVPGSSTQPPASRFDPNDMPPTIEEHPVGELGTPTTVGPPALAEDQTPTQEKPADTMDPAA